MKGRQDFPRVERAFRILEYLRKYTDEEHPTSQAKMRKDERIRDYIGHKKTFNGMIKELANILNFDEEELLKPEEDWRILFNDFKRDYGEEMSEDDNGEETDEVRIKGLYYQQEFSYDEVNGLIEGVLATKTLNSMEAKHLIKKIEQHLTTDFYRNDFQQVCKVREPELVDRELLKTNLRMIQEAIDKNVRIAFYFNGYTLGKKLEHVRPEKDVVSPYYIVANGGRYYLLACKESDGEKETRQNMSIWRIDLMSEMEIPGVREKLGIQGIPRVAKNKVANLPREWDDSFGLKHLNMSYDQSEKIILRVKSGKAAGTDSKGNPNYTFLHDWFGDTFRYLRRDPEEAGAELVEVECSPYSMVHWALQYSDRVEVISPEHVRNDIQKKIKALCGKYDVTL